MTPQEEGSSGPAPRPVVEIGDALVADLHDLGGDLDGGSLTASSLSMLRRDLRLAVRSLIGFSLTLTVPGAPVSVAFHVLDAPLAVDEVADCLAVPLPSHARGYTASLTVYAGADGALEDLRHDLGFAFGLAPAALVATVASASGTLEPGISGLDRFAEVHRSIGVLLSSGHTTATAGVELIRRAHHDPGGLAGAARAILERATSH